MSLSNESRKYLYNIGTYTRTYTYYTYNMDNIDCIYIGNVINLVFAGPYYKLRMSCVCSGLYKTVFFSTSKFFIYFYTHPYIYKIKKI